MTWVQIVLNYVVSSGDDGTVKLWDLETGDFIRNLVKLESAGNGGTMNYFSLTHTHTLDEEQAVQLICLCF